MTDFYETIFIGGGIACLAAARRWRGDKLVLEREARPGGMCRSDEVDGFTFDRTGHLLHLARPRTRRLVGRLLRGQLLGHQRDSWIYSHGVYTRYPFQAHFYGLPPEVAAECLLGVFEAQRAAPRSRGGARSFAAWARQRFGRGVARHFLLPYNRKLWTVSPRVLTCEWIGRFVPRPDLEQVVLGALCDRADPAGYNARFAYPVQGGIETLVQALARGAGRIWCGAEVVSVDLGRRELALRGGERLRFGRLVSSAPLPALVAMTRPLPDRIRRAARRLRAASVYNLNLGVRDRGERRHWVYLPEDRFGLYRFGYASNFSPAVAPPGCAAIYTELAFRQGSRPDPAGWRRRVLRDLRAIGVIRSATDVLVEHPLVLDGAYPIYDRARTPTVRRLLRHLARNDVFAIGRWGRWEYGSMEDAIAQGLDLADTIGRCPPRPDAEILP